MAAWQWLARALVEAPRAQESFQLMGLLKWQIPGSLETVPKAESARAAMPLEAMVATAGPVAPVEKPMAEFK